MGAYQAYLDLGFQGRLRQADELVRAEVSTFRDLIADYGLDATTVPKYTATGTIKRDASGQEISREVELKLLGTWTSVVIETRAPGVFVIYG